MYNTLLIDIQYFANLNYYKKLFNHTYIIFEKYNNFQKMSFQNRCVIAGSNGPLTLSVPLAGGRDQKCPVHEIGIANKEKWQRAHWRSIISAYNRSPWFEYYKDSLSVLYQQPFSRLIDWNLACLNWSLTHLMPALKWEFSTAYTNHYQDPELTDMRGRITPKTHPATPGGKQTEGVVYSQVFSEKTGFIANLSILDLLFCEGSRGAVSVLQR